MVALSRFRTAEAFHFLGAAGAGVAMLLLSANYKVYFYDHQAIGSLVANSEAYEKLWVPRSSP